MANGERQSQATTRPARRHSGPMDARQSAGEKNVTIAGRLPDESPNETEIQESGARPAWSDDSHTGTSRQDLISRRAYERFQMRGGEHGRDQDDWLEAEREMNKSVDE
jgi:hypothetical protein